MLRSRYHPATVNESPQRLIKLITLSLDATESEAIFQHFTGFFCPKSVRNNLKNIKATNSGTFWSLLQTQLRQEINKRLRKSYTFPFFPAYNVEDTNTN